MAEFGKNSHTNEDIRENVLLLIKSELVIIAALFKECIQMTSESLLTQLMSSIVKIDFIIKHPS